MPFENPDSLRQILISHNAHYILTGKVHQGDVTMYQKLLEVLKLIDNDPVLKERVHYIQDYDEELGRALDNRLGCLDKYSYCRIRSMRHFMGERHRQFETPHLY